MHDVTPDTPHWGNAILLGVIQCAVTGYRSPGDIRYRHRH